MLTKKSRLFLGLIAATPLFFAACTDNNILNPTTADVAGTYQLTLFRGVTPPVTDTYQAGQLSQLPNGGTITWTDGTMVLNSTGGFIETNNYTITPTGGQSGISAFVSTGAFTVSGTTFTLSAKAQNQFPARFATGTIAAGRITYQEANSSGGFDSFEYIQ